MEVARLGTVRFIHILRNLFEVDECDEPFSFEDLAAHAAKIYDTALDSDVLKLGLYLSADLGALR